MNTHTFVWSALVAQFDPDLVPQAIPNPDPGGKSFLWWFIETMGPTGLIVILLGVAIFVAACRVVAKSRQTSTLAAYLVLLPLPMFIEVLDQLRGIVASLSVLSQSETHLSNQEWAGCFAGNAVSMFLALLVTLPSYLVLAYGLLASTRGCSDAAPS